MKTTAASKVFYFIASSKHIGRQDELAYLCDQKGRILMERPHDRKGALYKGGTGVNLTGVVLTRW